MSDGTVRENLGHTQIGFILVHMVHRSVGEPPAQLWQQPKPLIATNHCPLGKSLRPLWLKIQLVEETPPRTLYWDGLKRGKGARDKAGIRRRVLHSSR